MSLWGKGLNVTKLMSNKYQNPFSLGKVEEKFILKQGRLGMLLGLSCSTYIGAQDVCVFL